MAELKIAPYLDYDGRDVYTCGHCHSHIFHLSHTQADEDDMLYYKFCHYCGFEIDWSSFKSQEEVEDV